MDNQESIGSDYIQRVLIVRHLRRISVRNLDADGCLIALFSFSMANVPSRGILMGHPVHLWKISSPPKYRARDL